MYKASIIGIDGTGKTEIVRALNKVEGIDTIHLTGYQGKNSGIARFFNNISTKLIQIGEDNHRKTLTGLAYALQLFPYYYEERAKQDPGCLVSDRDPIIDTLCYSSVYLPNFLAKMIRPRLKSRLEHHFNYPNIFFYLYGSPKFLASRDDEQEQIHEKPEELLRLKKLFEREISILGQEQIRPVHRINMEEVSSLEEVVAIITPFLGIS